MCLKTEAARFSADLRAFLPSGFHHTGAERSGSGRTLLGCSESRYTSLYRAEAGLLVVFDGTLFEHRGLLDRFTCPPGTTHAALLAKAYQSVGLDALSLLDGEYALALWDEACQRLVLARDVMGRGALCYTTTNEAIHFASEPSGLMASTGKSLEVNDSYIVGAMTFQFTPGETVYSGVHYPPVGHYLLAEREGPAQLRRYWFPERQSQLRVRDQREYAEALQHAMTQAVEKRLPSTGLVGSELSAGYDSSAVTALAARALARQNRQLHAYTSVPENPTDASQVFKNAFGNEWPLASRVAEMYPNIEQIAVPSHAASWEESISGMTDVVGAPPLFLRNLPWMYAMRKQAQSRGVDVMLWGQNGNHAGSYSGEFALFDLLRRGHLLQLLRTARGWRQAGSTWRSVALSAWLPSARARAHWKKLKGTSVKDWRERTFLKPERIAAAGFSLLDLERAGQLLEGNRRNGASRRFSNMQLIDFGVQSAAERRLFGLQRMDPTADRHLVELCLSIPDWAFCPGGDFRALYRQAMADVLPPELLRERRLGLQASDFLENFSADMKIWRSELERQQQSALVTSYLDVDRMRHALEFFPKQMERGRGSADHFYNYVFGGALLLGRFLRRVEERTRGKADCATTIFSETCEHASGQQTQSQS